MNARLAGQVLLLVVLVACTTDPSGPTSTSASSSVASPHPQPSPVRTPWDAEVANLEPDGTRSLDTALRLMAMAFGPIPGVDAATAAPGTVDSASPAVRAIRDR